MAARRRTASSDDQEGSGDNYKKKRERNNLAVKKCRAKSNVKAKETKERVDKLKKDNLRLETSISALKKNVKFLKDILLQNTSHEIYDREVTKILNEPDSDDEAET